MFSKYQQVIIKILFIKELQGKAINNIDIIRNLLI